ncbi:protein NETWORKED 2A-like [Prosopis cineraria]|uniref:protein NETWORKED 2A-like n=1 Tax=Prosopis cineraria TaxID=364024 RepID=UPI00240F19C0|nr:protein NETWORKED 2A-like [Prosopis cineraria]
MLQRAATNAYSWWWASHVRTKQSKWLEYSLQEMEEKVVETLKILDDEGDSFAKRAEMYYRKRPELISFVEESFRAYKSLAEKYDHLSRELQSANRTIASCFPERVHRYPLDEDEDEEESPGTSSTNDLDNPETPKSSIPKVPKIPKRDLRCQSMLISRKRPLRRNSSTAKPVTTTPNSGPSKAVALAEIDKLQKEILALQTEKEFVRSLYERAYEKHWEIEDQIEAMQKRVCCLQDVCGVGTVIEDNDARTLMAATALRSCQETLAKLQEIQAKSSEEAKVEYERVRQAHEKFEALRDQYISKHMSHQDPDADVGDKSETGGEEQTNKEEKASLKQEAQDVNQLREKIKEQLEEDSSRSLCVAEMAERIDELVEKVVSLETAISSQTGLVKRLRSETDDLQTNIKSLEEDNEMLKEGSDKMNKKLKELEEELRRVKNLNQNVKNRNNSLQTHFTEASCNLEHLSERLHDMKLEDKTDNSLHHKTMNSADVKIANEEKQEDAANPSEDVKNEDMVSSSCENMNFISERIKKLRRQENDDLSETLSNKDIEPQDFRGGEEDEPNWRQMFISGLDDREKILLEEYTSTLRNYKDVRMKLDDVEKKNRDGIFELALQVRELRSALATKDKEINLLQHRLVCPETNSCESPYTAATEYKYTPLEELLPSDSEISSLNLDANPGRTSFIDLIESRRDIGKSSESIKSPEDVEKFRANQVSKRHPLSTLEKKFRSDIDDLLEENLEFWLRFSTSLHQIQKFQNSIQDLQAELEKVKDHNNKNSNSKQPSSQSEIRPIFRHMREIRTELSLWLENNSALQDELHGRYSSLCNIQDEISRAAIADSELSRYQAAKFQGEVLHMKQENNKVASELQAGLSLVKRLKVEVDKTLEEVDQAFEVSTHSPIKQSSSSRNRIPLRSFLFGAKIKKQRQSLFACVNPDFSNLEATNENAPV